VIAASEQGLDESIRMAGDPISRDFKCAVAHLRTAETLDLGPIYRVPLPAPDACCRLPLVRYYT
jgi:hypothetical protein